MVESAAGELTPMNPEEARLKELADRMNRNPRIAHVDWPKALRRELAKVRPDLREEFLKNFERWARRQEEILVEEWRPDKRRVN